MTKSFFLLSSMITLAMASAAGNMFRVDLYQPTVISGTTFKAGEAKLELKDNKAIVHQGKTTAEAPVKVEANKSKYVLTTVGYKEGDGHQVKDICVGGTTTHILFE